MKKIEAIVRHFKLEDVKNALQQVDVGGLTIEEVVGTSRNTPPTQPYWHVDLSGKIGLQPAIKVTVVVGAAQVKDAVDAILRSARTGQPGDGEIFVTDLADAARIRTGERGEQAISA